MAYPYADAEILDHVRRAVLANKRTFRAQRKRVDWDDVASYAAERIAVYAAPRRAERPRTCMAPGCNKALDQPATGRVRTYCSNNCRARAGRRGVKANLPPMDLGIAWTWDAGQRGRFTQRALNLDVHNYVTSQLLHHIETVPLDVAEWYPEEVAA